jgi:septal ring-binding cell division protein DamX
MQAWLQKIDASVGAGAGEELEPPLDATPSEIVATQLVAEDADPQAPALVALPAPDTQAITSRIAGALKVETQKQPGGSNSEAESAIPSPQLTLDPVWDGVRTDLQIERVLQSLQPDGAQAVSSRLLAALVLPETPTQPLEPLGPNATLDVKDEPTLGTTPVAAASVQVVADTKLPDGNAWVQSLPPGAWLIQYVSVGNEAKARQWIAGRPQLTGLYPVAVLKRSNKERHVVVLKGPFVNRLSAQAFATSADSIKEHWVRSARSVRADMVTP